MEVRLVDIRPRDSYVAGHVPGALNVPTGQNLTAEGLFRPVAELRALVAERTELEETWLAMSVD